MAQVIGNQVKLDDGKLITPSQGAWYNGQQYWNGTLSAPGQINPQSNQQGAGQQVSPEVIAQTNPANVGYVQKQQQKYQAPSTPFNAPTAQPTGTVNGAGVGFTAPETPNFPDIYKNLYESSGIKQIQDEISGREKQYLEARAKISDNPFLDASIVDKRLARLDAKYQSEVKPLSDKMAMQKADVETDLNLRMKQFDIESQVAKDALSRFNTLLKMGTLDNASGDDIANITRSTGISSSMIQAAVDANRKKNVETQVITSTNDSGVVTATVIDKNTGTVISQQNLGAIGNAQTGGAGSAAKTIKAQFAEEAGTIGGKSVNGTWWGIFPQLVAKYAPYMSLEEIYSIYATSPAGQQYGTPSENAKDMKELYDYYREGKEPE